MSNSVPEAPIFKDLEFEPPQILDAIVENIENEVLQLSLPEVDVLSVLEANNEESLQILDYGRTSEEMIIMKNAKSAYTKDATLGRKSNSSLKMFNYKVT